jgi:NAD(P)-dependent dehydrogenase (short-subunit alcohol dehydrogenase family)
MELSDKVVVITGAASGSGRAMALRFAAEQARAVVLADVDVAGAASVANEIAATATSAAAPVFCDVAEPSSVVEVIRYSVARFGCIDLYCANAGVGLGGDLETPDEGWERAFSVNVRSHIVAARELVPGWLRRGGGYFLSTASAAGLLGLIGAAPYTVTKHAAVAFAEWLLVTYGDRGVAVSCLCPMAVRTTLLRDGLAAPGEAGLGLQAANAGVPALDPDDVAACVVEGLRSERFLILPHPQIRDLMITKASDPERWVRRMRAVHADVRARAPQSSATEDNQLTGGDLQPVA